jgi:hypothetical protein
MINEVWGEEFKAWWEKKNKIKLPLFFLFFDQRLIRLPLKLIDY